MSQALLNRMIEPLPSSLREQIVGYTEFVNAASEDLFAEAGIDYDLHVYEKFVFLAGMRRLWVITNCNYQLLENSFRLLQKGGAT